jgi:hypothetical protein
LIEEFRLAKMNEQQVPSACPCCATRCVPCETS